MDLPGSDSTGSDSHRSDSHGSKVRELFDSLADLSPEARGQRLAQVNDPRIVLEVRDLLQNHDQAFSNFLVTNNSVGHAPARDLPFAFNPGDVLAQRFSIVRPLGRGGMGEVYEADDRNSGKRVALKCITKSIQNESTIRQFRREIDVARQITDPNVCRINDIFVHGSGDVEILLLSMELIVGDTLQQRLASHGPIPPSAAEPLIRQLLSGLAAVHRARIVHRDLKPGNVLIEKAGPDVPERLVITDFGLARKQQTITTDITIAEEVAGTFEYMAPEQVEGKAVQASDIYAAGLIIFEMLTGRKPFDGSPMQQAAQRLVNDPPAARKFSKRIRPQWNCIIRRCLERNPARRFQTAEQVIRSFEGELQWYGFTSLFWWSCGRWKTILALACGFAASIAIAAAFFMWVREEGPKSVSLSPATTGGGLTMHSTISRDGALLAYVSDRETQLNLQLWVQKTADEASRRRLTDDQFDTSVPSFSNDGKRIVFRWERGRGGLYVADVLWGQPRLLVKGGIEGRFSPDDRSIAYWTGQQAEIPGVAGALYLISVDGGKPRRLVPDFASASNPVFLNDGRHLLFEGLRQPGQSFDHETDWYVLDLNSGAVSATGALERLRRKTLRPYNQRGNFLGNRLIFSARSETAANIYEYRLDPHTFKVTNDPEQLTYGTDLMDAPSVSRNGILAVTSGSGALNIWRLGNGGAGPDSKLTSSLHLDSHPTVSADGTILGFTRTLGRERQIWVKVPTGERALVTTRQEKYWPVIRRDGAEIAFSAAEDNGHSIYTVKTEGGTPTRLCPACGDPSDWSHDGRYLLIGQGTPSKIGVLDVNSGSVRTVASGTRDLGEARFGPDDRTVAFREALGTGRSRIVVASADPDSPSPWIPITSGEAEDDKPQWSEDGKAIYFLSSRDSFKCLYLQRLNLRKGSVSDSAAGTPVAVRHFHSHTFTPAEVSSLAFNFVVARGQIIANPATLHGEVWTGLLSPRK